MGLVRDNLVAEIIEHLAPFARSFEFRYLKTGLKALLVLGEVERAVDEAYPGGQAAALTQP